MLEINESRGAIARSVETPGFRIATLEIERRESIGTDRYSHASFAAKRLVDVVLSLVVMTLAAPMFAAVWLAIRLTSPGPAIFSQSRVGYGEESFTMLKFRTMHNDNDDSAHREFVTAMLRAERTPEIPDEKAGASTYKMVDDPRITPIGKFLRKTSLDEMPQLLNVLRGEMSLVGPRPCLAYEADEFAPRHRQRARSLPGITGLWQITGRNDLHMQDALDLDVEYVETCSLRLDLMILVKTLLVVLRGSGV